MPRKTQEFEIDGHLYQVQQVGAETGDAILFRLGRGLAMSDLKPEDFEHIRSVLRDSTKLQIVDTKGDGRKSWVPLSDKYGDHFAGRYEVAAEWFRAAFEFNFASFIDVIRKFVVTRMAAASSSSPKGVPGDFGDSLLHSILGSPVSPTSSETGQSTTSPLPTNS
jgi:hypothetical protein